MCACVQGGNLLVTEYGVVKVADFNASQVIIIILYHYIMS